MSDYLKHDANAVSAFMGKLGAHGEKHYSRIDELIVFGDCCGHQHKSKAHVPFDILMFLRK